MSPDVCVPEIICPKCGKAVSDSDDGAMGCYSVNCNLWWHRDCLEVDEAAFADLSIMEGSCWTCPSCSATIERQCAVCLKTAFVAPSMIDTWIRCGNAHCGQWFCTEHFTDEALFNMRGPDDSFWCNVCLEE